MKKILILLFLSLSATQFTHADKLDSKLVLSFLPSILEEKAVATATEKTICEHFDDTLVNSMNLEIASSDAKQKIEKVEEVIEGESFFRDSILSSVKSFFGLQKKDKVIFREIKKEIDDAKIYYENVDGQVVETNKFLEDNFCEDLRLETASKLDENMQNMVDDEVTFRKQFAGSLKDKMKILQEATKSAKK